MTRVTPLALLALGMLWAGNVTLLKVAAELPLPATDPSIERRLRRWLANRQVPVTGLWRPLITPLLASRAGQEVVLAVDPTPHNDLASILVVGLVTHQRVLPLLWHPVSNQQPWSHGLLDYLDRMFRTVGGWLPADCTVTITADRGLTSAGLIRLSQRRGWHFVLRVSADEQQGLPIRDATGQVRPIWTLVEGPGRHWFGQAEVFQSAGWIPVEISVIWQTGYDEPWILLSDRPAGWARGRGYRRRDQAEATYEDCKRRGWNVEASKVTHLGRLHRLLLAVFVALWWAHYLGQPAMRRGARRQFDRADRRDLSLLRLGRRWLAYLLDQGRCPPFLFVSRPPTRSVACLP